MTGRSRLWRVPFTAVVLAMMAGCGVNSTFVYKPGTPSAGGAKLPVKVAVLPFKDGTEDFTQRGSVFGNGYTWNLAKTGMAGTITALTPELWAKSFADDIAASGDFQTARFIYSLSELEDEAFYIEGTLGKSYYTSSPDKQNEFALRLRSVRREDNKLIWEKEVTKAVRIPRVIYTECGVGIKCVVDMYHADFNRVMRNMFAEARLDLVKAISSQSLKFGGVGIQIGIEGGAHVVTRVMQGAPAWKAGVQAGDSVLSIDGKPTGGMTVAEFVDRARGVKGTTVSLGIKRTGWDAPREFTLVRDVIKVEGSRPQAPESAEQTIDRILEGK